VFRDVRTAYRACPWRQGHWALVSVRTALPPRSLIALSGILAIPFATRTWQWDDWWHLATGRWMAETHQLPTFDAFSFTARGEPWHAASWGSDILFFAAYSCFGIAGLALAKVLAAFVVQALLAVALRELGVTVQVAGATMVAAAVFFQSRNTSARPEIFAAVLLSASIVVALKSRRAPRVFFGFVPITLVWLAAHSSAVLAPVVCMTALVGILLAGAQKRALLEGACALILSLVPFALTSAGRDVIYIASMHNERKSPLAMQLTFEWKRSGLFDSGAAVPTALLLAGFVGALVVIARAHGAARREAFRTRVLPLGLGALGTALWLQSDRHVATAVLLNAPLWCLALTSLGNSIDARAGQRIASAAAPVVGVAVVALQLGFAPYNRHRLFEWRPAECSTNFILADT
jgi:hypothetical protein